MPGRQAGDPTAARKLSARVMSTGTFGRAQPAVGSPSSHPASDHQ
jgi:hypothetical protein